MIVFIFIQCWSFFSFGQLSKNEFDNWVDYVTVYYVKSYVEKKIKSDDSSITDDYKNNYNGSINKKWDDILKNPKNFNSKQFKRQLGGHTGAIQLFSIIQGKKDSYADSFDKEKIINILTELPKDKPTIAGDGFRGYLQNATLDLNPVLNSEIKEDEFHSQEEDPSSEVSELPSAGSKSKIDNSSNGDELNEPDGQGRRNNDLKKKSNGVFGKLLFLVFLGAISYFGYKYRQRIKQAVSTYTPQRNIKKTESSRDDIKNQSIELLNERKMRIEFEEENNRLRIENKRNNNEIRELKVEIQNLKDKVSNYEKHSDLSELQMEDSIKRTQSISPTKPQVITDKPKENYVSLMYADAIIDNYLHKVTTEPDDDTIYEINLSPFGNSD